MGSPERPWIPPEQAAPEPALTSDKAAMLCALTIADGLLRSTCEYLELNPGEAIAAARDVIQEKIRGIMGRAVAIQCIATISYAIMPGHIYVSLLGNGKHGLITIEEARRFLWLGHKPDESESRFYAAEWHDTVMLRNATLELLVRAIERMEMRLA